MTFILSLLIQERGISIYSCFSFFKLIFTWGYFSINFFRERGKEKGSGRKGEREKEGEGEREGETLK